MLGRILFAALAALVPLSLAAAVSLPVASGRTQPIYEYRAPGAEEKHYLALPLAIGTPPQTYSIRLTADSAAADAGQLVLHSPPTECLGAPCEHPQYDSAKSSSANVTGTTRLGGPFNLSDVRGISFGGVTNLTALTDIVTLGDKQASIPMWMSPPAAYHHEENGQLDFGLPASGAQPWWEALESRVVGLDLAHRDWNATDIVQTGQLTFGVNQSAAVAWNGTQLPIAPNDTQWRFELSYVAAGLKEMRKGEPDLVDAAGMLLWSAIVKPTNRHAVLTFKDEITLPAESYAHLARAITDLPDTLNRSLPKMEMIRGSMETIRGSMETIPCDTTILVSLQLASGLMVEIHPNDWVRPGWTAEHALRNQCSHAFRSTNDTTAPISLGLPFLRSVYTVFDFEKRQVSFAPPPSQVEKRRSGAGRGAAFFPAAWFAAASILVLAL